METITEDWNKFGQIEIEEAKELLSQIKDIDAYGQIKVMFNMQSGCVFLTDEEYRTWMINNGKIEEWFNCPYCGHEGFLEDMNHEPEDKECTEYLKQIGAIKEDSD
jgi:hypothetical protein